MSRYISNVKHADSKKIKDEYLNKINNFKTNIYNYNTLVNIFKELKLDGKKITKRHTKKIEELTGKRCYLQKHSHTLDLAKCDLKFNDETFYNFKWNTFSLDEFIETNKEPIQYCKERMILIKSNLSKIETFTIQLNNLINESKKLNEYAEVSGFNYTFDIVHHCTK